MSARDSCALDEAPQTFSRVHAGPLRRLLPSGTPGQSFHVPWLQSGRPTPRPLDVRQDPPGPQRYRGGAARGCPRRGPMAPPSEPPRGRGRRRPRGGGGSLQAGPRRSVRLGPPRRGDPPAGSGGRARARWGPGRAINYNSRRAPRGRAQARRRRGRPSEARSDWPRRREAGFAR